MYIDHTFRSDTLVERLDDLFSLYRECILLYGGVSPYSDSALYQGRIHSTFDDEGTQPPSPQYTMYRTDTFLG